jgi:hypothetical protein
MGFFKFFTFKTTSRLFREEEERAARQSTLDTPRGLTANFDAEQKLLDEKRAIAAQFLTDIENFLGPLAKYAGQDYMSEVKQTQIERGLNVRFGIIWRNTAQDDKLAVTIAFSYTMFEFSKVRIDYIVKVRGVAGDAKEEVINDKYDPRLDNIYMDRSLYDDDLRSVRVYQTHEEFVAHACTYPTWFANYLKLYAKPVTP